MVPYIPVLRIRIRDPESAAFLTPESWIPDPGSQTHIFESILKNFWLNYNNSLKIRPNFFL
jgi:hypothetical protein